MGRNTRQTNQIQELQTCGVAHTIYNKFCPTAFSRSRPLFFLSRLLFSLWVSCNGSASDWCALQEALHKCINTIQYKSFNQCLMRLHRSTYQWSHCHEFGS